MVVEPVVEERVEVQMVAEVREGVAVEAAEQEAVGDVAEALTEVKEAVVEMEAAAVVVGSEEAVRTAGVDSGAETPVVAVMVAAGLAAAA